MQVLFDPEHPRIVQHGVYLVVDLDLTPEHN